MWIAEDAEQKLRVGWAILPVQKQGHHALSVGDSTRLWYGLP